MRVCLCSSSVIQQRNSFVHFCIQPRYGIGDRAERDNKKYYVSAICVTLARDVSRNSYPEDSERNDVSKNGGVICWQRGWIAREQRIFFDHGRTLLTSPRTKPSARVDHYVRAEISSSAFTTSDRNLRTRKEGRWRDSRNERLE